MSPRLKMELISDFLKGQWVATKLLWPIERDIYQLRRHQRAFADEHIKDTRIVIDRVDRSELELLDREESKSFNGCQFGGQNGDNILVYKLQILP